MKVKVTVMQTDRHPGDRKIIAVVELARVPVSGDYLIVNNRRVKVEWVELVDNGDVIVEVS